MTWISLHTACKRLRVAGKKLNKAEKVKRSFIFLVWHLVCGEPGRRKQTWGVRGTLVPMSGGRIGGTTEFIQAPEQWSRAGPRPHGCSICSLYHCVLLICPFSLNRYRIMGNLLKVLTCTDLEQEPNFFLDFESESLSLFFKKKSNPPPLLISITWISYHNIINSETKSFHPPSSSPTLSFTLCSSQRQKKRRKSTTGASVLPINLPLPYWNVCRISIRAELQLSNIKRWSSAAV